MSRSIYSKASSNPWIASFLFGASASLTMIWFSKMRKRSSTIYSTAKSERKKSSGAIEEELLDHETLSNRMLRKAEAVIQLRTSRLVLVIERCTNGRLSDV